MKKFFVLLCCCLISFSQAEEIKNNQPSLDLEFPDRDFLTKPFQHVLLGEDKHSGKSEMNGIAFADYVTNFDQLTLVTIRYREDSNELRMVYGNSSAIEGLRNNGTYKKGATFYKVAYAAVSDPAYFPSKVPRHDAVRYQVMKYDLEKYKTGWGYAIFDINGKTFPGEPVGVMNTCMACHDLAKDRNYVFSTMMKNPNPGKNVPGDEEQFKKLFSSVPDEVTSSEKSKPQSGINFEKNKWDEIPEKVRELLGPKKGYAYKLTGSLTNNDFIGHLPESVPILIQKSLKSNVPVYALEFKQRYYFTFVYRDPETNSCEKGKIKFRYGFGFYFNGTQTTVRLSNICVDPKEVKSFSVKNKL